MASPDDYLCLPTPDRKGFELRALEFRGLLTRLLDLQAVWAERGQQRRALAMLDDRMLADIGLDRAAVSREEAKLFWRP